MIKIYSIEEPGLALVLNYTLQLQSDPAMGGRLNEAVALSIRPGTLAYDASGLIGDELVMEAMLTRTQLREILDTADALWFDDCAACGWHPRTGKKLARFSPWRLWAKARAYTWSKKAPAPLKALADRWTWRVAR